MTELENKIYEIVRKIPAGKVATYAQVAELAGNKKRCRVVGNTMHKNPLPFIDLGKACGFKGELNGHVPAGFEPVPCHRVVNSKGQCGANFGMGGPEVQQKMLEAEGIQFEKGKVKL